MGVRFLRSEQGIAVEVICLRGSLILRASGPEKYKVQNSLKCGAEMEA